MSHHAEPPAELAEGPVLAACHGDIGIITLNRPSALNALSLDMVRTLTAILLAWRADVRVAAVLLRGAGREGKAPAFCAGGDIRFFHQAALAGDPRLEDFFTEEYALDHLIHVYPKPVMALVDGVCMGGGMGLSQGAGLRVVAETARLAMPETQIGLFPDVGGGWFLARCPGHLGEYLGLTGQTLNGAEAMSAGQADHLVPADRWPALIESLVRPLAAGLGSISIAERIDLSLRRHAVAADPTGLADLRPSIDLHFSLPSLAVIVASLAEDPSGFAQSTLAQIHKRSPIMLSVTLAQIRRARGMSLAEDLRMERDLVRHCFHLRPGTASETVEGIRALAIDKDHQPRWNPGHIDDVSTAEVEAFFVSPWPAHVHPLRQLD